MKIRTGFVTNSSSTNFLILSKEELTPQFLYKELGFKKGSIIEEQAMELCEEIINGTEHGLIYYGIEEINKDVIEREFGEDAATKYEKYIKKGYIPYIGSTSNDESTFTRFFTTDTFEIEEKDLYINGRNCIW